MLTAKILLYFSAVSTTYLRLLVCRVAETAHLIQGRIVVGKSISVSTHPTQKGGMIRQRQRQRRRRWVPSFLMMGTGIVLPGGYLYRAQSVKQINE